MRIQKLLLRFPHFFVSKKVRTLVGLRQRIRNFCGSMRTPGLSAGGWQQVVAKQQRLNPDH